MEEPEEADLSDDVAEADTSAYDTAADHERVSVRYGGVQEVVDDGSDDSADSGGRASPDDMGSVQLGLLAVRGGPVKVAQRVVCFTRGSVDGGVVVREKGLTSLYVAVVMSNQNPGRDEEARVDPVSCEAACYT